MCELLPFAVLSAAGVSFVMMRSAPPPGWQLHADVVHECSHPRKIPLPEVRIRFSSARGSGTSV